MAVDKPQSTAEEILAALGDAADAVELFHNHVLLATWIRPEKTEGGLYLPDKTRAEDQYQGKIGLVISKGPAAFVNDARNDFFGKNVERGDWVMFRVTDGMTMDLNGVHCRMIEDVFIRGKVPSPKIVW